MLSRQGRCLTNLLCTPSTSALPTMIGVFTIRSSSAATARIPSYEHSTPRYHRNDEPPRAPLEPQYDTSKTKGKKRAESIASLPSTPTVTKTKVKAKPKSSSTKVLKPPKRCPHSWALFLKEYHQEVKKRNDPEERALTAKEHLIRAGEAYRALTSYEKEDLQKRLEEEHARYEQDFAEWQASLNPEDLQKEVEKKQATKASKSKKNRIDPNEPQKPKRPLNAFLVFFNSRIANEDLVNLAPRERTAELARQWKSLSPEERVPFDQQAAELALEYKRNLANYLQEQQARLAAAESLGK